MIQILNSQDKLVKAPDFPGWLTLGLDVPVEVGDVFVCLHMREQYRNPNTSPDIILENHSYGTRTPREKGEGDMFCIYRKRKWIQLTGEDVIRDNDILITASTTLQNPNINSDYLHYGLTLTAGDYDLPVSALVYNTKESVWREITPSKETQVKKPLSGNAHYGKPLPLP